MASGLPVVAADAPGSRCVVDAPAVGSLISAKRDAEMVAALQELVSNEVTRRRKSLAARAPRGDLRVESLSRRDASELRERDPSGPFASDHAAEPLALGQWPGPDSPRELVAPALFVR